MTPVSSGASQMPNYGLKGTETWGPFSGAALNVWPVPSGLGASSYNQHDTTGLSPSPLWSQDGSGHGGGQNSTTASGTSFLTNNGTCGPECQASANMAQSNISSTAGTQLVKPALVLCADSTTSPANFILGQWTQASTGGKSPTQATNLVLVKCVSNTFTTISTITQILTNGLTALHTWTMKMRLVQHTTVTSWMAQVKMWDPSVGTEPPWAPMSAASAGSFYIAGNAGPLYGIYTQNVIPKSNPEVAGSFPGVAVGFPDTTGTTYYSLFDTIEFDTLNYELPGQQPVSQSLMRGALL